MALAHRFLVFLYCFILCASSASAEWDWKIITHDKKQYVSLNSIKEFYFFNSMTRKGSSVVLESQKVKMQLRVGSQECLMNGLKFILSDSVLAHGTGLYLSSNDLTKLIDPVLRPEKIISARPFQTVIIDPGHGGKDCGANNQYGTEAYYNLTVARLVRDILLKNRGYKVVMTRNSDIFYSLDQRVAMANKYSNAVFLSIHFNAGGGREARGIETFTLSPAGVAHYGRNLKKSDFKERRGNYQDSANIAFASAVHSMALEYTKVPDRGIKRARFSVLTGIKHPAILLEGGFMSHPFEARLIHSPKYQKNLAFGIARGIDKFRRALFKRKY